MTQKKVGGGKMKKPILKENKKVVKIGNSRGVTLPSWWLKDGTKVVEMEVFSDRIILRKEGEK